MGTARAEARIIFHRRFVNAVEAALSKHDVMVTDPVQSFFGVKGKKDKLRSSGNGNGTGTGTSAPSHSQAPGEDNCMACNRPLSTTRFKSQSSWQNTLLNSQPLAPSLTAIEANTHKLATSEAPPRPRQVVEIPQTNSPHRHTAVYSTDAKIAMSHAQADAISAAMAAATHLGDGSATPHSVPEEAGASEPAALAPGAEWVPSNHLPPERSSTPLLNLGPVTFGEPQLAGVGGGDVACLAVQQQTAMDGHPGGTRTVVLQTKTDSMDRSAVLNQSNGAGDRGGRPSSSSGRQQQQRPVSASSNAGRHKGAIKDAYVMRGGFKMKIKSQQAQGSESSTALLFSGQGTNGVTGGGGGGGGGGLALSKSSSLPHTDFSSANA